MAQTIFYPNPTFDSSFHWVEDLFEGGFDDTPDTKGNLEVSMDFSEVLQEMDDEILCDNNTRNLNFDCQLGTEVSTSRKPTSGDMPTDLEDILQKIDEEAGHNKNRFTFNTSIGSISLYLEDKITHSSPHVDSGMRPKNLHSSQGLECDHNNWGNIDDALATAHRMTQLQP